MIATLDDELTLSRDGEVTVAEETFGARLRRLREDAGLTQQELADRISTHRMTIAKLEQNENGPTWTTVKALARALGTNCLAFEDTVEPAEGEKKPGRRGRPPRSKPTSPADQGDQPATQGEAAEPAPEPESKPRRRKKE